MLRTNSHKLGFTLVELLIVISIIGILASIALVSFRNAQLRGRDTERKSDLKQIGSALELFYSDYQKYPSASSGKISACPYNPNINPATGTDCTWGEGEFRDLSSSNQTKTTYFKVLPKDPTSGFSYLYRADSSNQKYQLYAHIENTQDINIDSNITSLGYQCGSQICNFGISSSNTSPTETW